MSLTRDQLRAARVLLHMRQPQLAEIARIGIATIRRFEGGQEIGHLHLDAIAKALVEAGVVLVDGGDGQPAKATGVILKPTAELPPATLARIAASRATGDREAATPLGEGIAKRKRGRPPKRKPGEVDAPTPDGVTPKVGRPPIEAGGALEAAVAAAPASTTVEPAAGIQGRLSKGASRGGPRKPRKKAAGTGDGP